MINKNNSFFIILKIFIYSVFGILIAFSISLNSFTVWFSQTFTVGIQQLLFTIKSPLQGSDTDFLKDIIVLNVFLIILFSIVYVTVVIIFERVFSKFRAYISVSIGNKRKKLLNINLYYLLFLFFGLFVFLFSLFSLKNSESKIHFFDFLQAQKKQTTIYEDYYSSPSETKITGKGRNLIFIYIESMETSYASVEEGGYQPYINYIPNLIRLAKENINFSQTDKTGGFTSCNGSGWTMGALFASSTGVPFSFPVQGNDMDMRKTFASGITAMGDILAEKGYVNEFLCGSDANFAGRKQFFMQHGNYKIFDIFTAREQGYISEDYWVFWGFEDEILFKIAKDELKKLSKSDAPFNFTLLTVDMHHVGGYRCNLCGDEYPENLANVVSCDDKQVYEFVRWIQNQDFYENTTIVIVGDHPRMDSILVNDIPYNNRYVYNCFINADKKVQLSNKNRKFCTIDIFPTVLSSMGFSIEGNRLGLGTDLFSATETLSEEMGIEELNNEFSKYSEYYIDNFS